MKGIPKNDVGSAATGTRATSIGSLHLVLINRFAVYLDWCGYRFDPRGIDRREPVHFLFFIFYFFRFPYLVSLVIRLPFGTLGDVFTRTTRSTRN